MATTKNVKPGARPVFFRPQATPIIALCTDFGRAGPYVGQMEAVLHRGAPHARVIDLFCELPPFNPRAAAYLLPAYATDFPPGTVFLCVVDPGVGDESRRPAVLRADGHWFVGPENGLFNMVGRRAAERAYWAITWRPADLSASFHGRDLFAPVAAMLARGEAPPGEPCAVPDDPAWPDDLPEIVYIDHYGNAVTGMRRTALPAVATLRFKNRSLAHGRTFSDLAPGRAFWYENANGLVEIAVNRGRACEVLGAAVGDPVALGAPP